MSTIHDDYESLLADFAQSSLSGEPAPEPEAPTQDAEPTETPEPQPSVPTASDEVTDEPAATEPADTDPVVDKPTNEDDDDDDSVFGDWDDTQTSGVDSKPDSPSEPSAVLSEIGSAFGLEKVESKEALISAIKAKLETPETQNIPAELAKAIDISRKGGDYLEYLKITSTDYSQADPVSLYEDYVIDQFTGPDGTVDEDQLNDYLDSLPEAEKKLRGRELQNRLVYEQKRRAAEIEAEAIREKEQRDAELRAALGNLQTVDSFKVSDQHRKEVFDWVTGKMMQDLFYGADGKPDPEKVAKVAFRNLYYDKLHAYMVNKAKKSTKREILDTLTNAQIKTPAAPPDPKPKKQYGIDDYIKSLEENMLNR